MREKLRVKHIEISAYRSEKTGLGLVINYLSLGNRTFGVPARVR
jgi:hypothetical protein